MLLVVIYRCNYAIGYFFYRLLQENSRQPLSPPSRISPPKRTSLHTESTHLLLIWRRSSYSFITDFEGHRCKWAFLLYNSKTAERLTNWQGSRGAGEQLSSRAGKPDSRIAGERESSCLTSGDKPIRDKLIREHLYLVGRASRAIPSG